MLGKDQLTNNFNPGGPAAKRVGWSVPSKNEPPREKTNNLRMRYKEADERLCFRFKDSTILLLSRLKISSL